jgi:hypothetical protein
LTNASRNIVDVVDCLFDTGIGVYIIVGAYAFEESVDSIARKMLATIKAHVFEEVSQATLVFFFLQTAYALS